MTMTPDEVYAFLLSSLLHCGVPLTTRNSPVRRLIATQYSFASTPLISLRRTAWKNALREMEWFLSGSSSIHDLHPAVRSWWEPWADAATGEVASNYSVQFRDFRGEGGSSVDQIALLLSGLRDHPFSRRHVATTWHAAEMADPATPITNCHGTVIQCFVDADNFLDLVMYQRSVDVVCGLPHNWVQYWGLLLWLAARTGRKPGRFIWIGGDVHLYECHYDLAREIVAALPAVNGGRVPELIYTPTSEEFRADDFRLDGEYRPVVTTRAEMVV